MEKKLLLLGALRNHEMHGYQLSEVLGHRVGLPIRLTKPNAYKLLRKMEQDGWVSSREEQDGKRPPRRVYKITPSGEIAFQEMLRESLGSYNIPEFPGTVAINFLDLLPLAEAISLLAQRREEAADYFKELDELSAEVRVSHPSIEYLIQFLQSELKWLDELIDRQPGT